MPHHVVSESVASPQQLADVFAGPVYLPRPWPSRMTGPVHYRVDTVPEAGKRYYLAYAPAHEGVRLLTAGSPEPPSPTFRAGEFGSPTQRWFAVPELASEQAVAVVKPTGDVTLVLSKPAMVLLSGHPTLDEAIHTAQILACFTPAARD